jgi:hypothetical protein
MQFCNTTTTNHGCLLSSHETGHIYCKHFTLHKTDNSCLFGFYIATIKKHVSMQNSYFLTQLWLLQQSINSPPFRKPTK